MNQNSVKVLIVDDERSARHVLAGYIEKYCPELELIGEADQIVAAKSMIEKHHPDLVFLDVEMPGGSGFDLLDQLSDLNFGVIFVTAFDQYAIQAINHGAAYYLLKPLSIDDLIDAVKKFTSEKSHGAYAIRNKIVTENVMRVDAQQRRLVLPLMDGFEVVKVADIVHCTAHDNFSDIFLTDGRKRMICRTLKFYEDLLTDDGFMRVHKSHLINLTHVTKYMKSGGGSVVLIDGTEVPLSPQKKDMFLKYFENGR